MRMVNSNQIIFASVALDTNTNGTESHVYISCKQIKYAVHTRATCVIPQRGPKPQTEEHSLNNIT